MESFISSIQQFTAVTLGLNFVVRYETAFVLYKFISENLK